jgi:hypothetical protein
MSGLRRSLRHRGRWASRRGGWLQQLRPSLLEILPDGQLELPAVRQTVQQDACYDCRSDERTGLLARDGAYSEPKKKRQQWN